MATFGELQKTLNLLHNKLEILTHLIEYIDQNFIAYGGSQPLKYLLNEQRVKIPVEPFEEILEFLTSEAGNLTSKAQSITSSGVQIKKEKPKKPSKNPPIKDKK